MQLLQRVGVILLPVIKGVAKHSKHIKIGPLSSHLDLFKLAVDIKVSEIAP